MAEEPEVVDATAVEEPAPARSRSDIAQPPAAAAEPSQELVPSEHAGVIIRAHEPADIIRKASAIADTLKDLVEKQGLSVNVGGKRKHVEVGGWQALGSLLGALGGEPLHAETVWTRPAKDQDGNTLVHRYTAEVKRYHRKDQGGGVRETTTYEVDGHDWEARVEIKTASGVVVGAAESMCSRTEETWAKRPDPAVRSMAETRAESRAYRRAVGWIVNIAGYNPTPAEEMPEKQAEEAGPPFGDAASEKLAETTQQAIAYLLDTGDGPNLELAKAVLGKINDDAGGYLPKIVGRAFAWGAKTLKDHIDGKSAEAGTEAPPAEAEQPPEQPAEEPASEASDPDPEEQP